MPRGDVAVVTGASTGIGLWTARKLATEGFVTYAAMRGPLDRREARELRELAAKKGLPLHVVELDVANPSSCAACVDAVRRGHGRIDALVNNAGISSELAGMEEHPTEKPFYDVMEANYFGAVRLCRLVLPEMRSRGRGDIINVTSVAGIAWSATNSAYNASKAALEAASATLTQEVARFGIRVCTVRPGVIVTPILVKTNKPVDKSAPASPYADQVRLQKKFFEAGAGLMQHPSLVANVIARLLGDSAGWKAYYTVGRDGEALTKTVLGRGLDYVVQSAQKKETDDEYIARMREWGVDVSKPFKKKAARL